MANAYFWHRFYSHQPDLNYDNPAVWEAVFPLVDFWFGMGVDGLRLDAVPYLYEREGTNCENLPETHEFLKALRKHVDEKFPSPPRMFLAEANQWPEDAVAYFGDDDECHMAFHFPVMPRLFMALHQEDRFPILDILAQTPSLPGNSQWCMFLRNHDELTLEMVTDEERDSMYRAYAQDPEARINLGIRHRLAPLLYNDRRRIELMTALLFSLPGTPVLYYGDEIGMGDNIYLGDRNGVRTPMQWSPDRNAGFSNCNPQKLYFPVITDSEYHYEAINVESQQRNPSSLLWWMKRMIALRKQHMAFGRGALEFLRPDNAKILVFIRAYDGERILVVANLSRFVQYVELDLREYLGCTPEELAGRSQLPPIDDRPYRLTLSPYAFYWFLLKPADVANPALDGDPMRVGDLPDLAVGADWRAELCGKDHSRLEAILPGFLARRRSPALPRIVAVQVARSFADPMGSGDIQWLVVRLELANGDTESNFLPLLVVNEEESLRLLESPSIAVLARLTGNQRRPALRRDVRPRLRTGTASCHPERPDHPPGRRRVGGRVLEGTDRGDERPQTLAVTQLIRSERFNATLVFDEQLTLKMFRSVETEINPDFEIRAFLTARQEAPIVAPVLGYIEFRRVHGPPVTVAVLNQYIPNQGTAWNLTVNQLSQFYERVAAHSHRRTAETPNDPSPAVHDPGAEASLEEIIGGFETNARKIGVQTALLHRTLASDSHVADFRPEPFSRLYQRSLYQAMRNLTHQVFTRLTRELSQLPEEVQADAAHLLSLREPLLGPVSQDRGLASGRDRESEFTATTSWTSSCTPGPTSWWSTSSPISTTRSASAGSSGRRSATSPR